MDAKAFFVPQPPEISPQPDRVILNMNLQEALTLKQLFMNSGGDPYTSPRRHTASLNKALTTLGIRSANHRGTFDIFFDSVERSTL